MWLCYDSYDEEEEYVYQDDNPFKDVEYTFSEYPCYRDIYYLYKLIRYDIEYVIIYAIFTISAFTTCKCLHSLFRFDIICRKMYLEAVINSYRKDIISRSEMINIIKWGVDSLGFENNIISEYQPCYDNYISINYFYQLMFITLYNKVEINNKELCKTNNEELWKTNNEGLLESFVILTCYINTFIENKETVKLLYEKIVKILLDLC